MDLSKLSSEDLAAEMKRRETAQQDQRKAYKELVNETVPTVFKIAETASKALQMAKLQIFESLSSILEFKEEAYGIKEGQRSHTFTTENGESITIGYRINDAWDDTHTAGIEKVNKFIESLAKDDDSAKLVKALNKLLQKDKAGNLKSSRVIELQNMAEDFDNPLFTDGVQIIVASYKPSKSVYYIEASYKSETGKDLGVPLSISAVDFPEGTSFPFFNKTEKL